MNKQAEKEKIAPLKRIGVYAAGSLLAGLALTEAAGVAYVAGQVNGAHQTADEERRAASALRTEGDHKEARVLVDHANTLETWADDMTSPDTALLASLGLLVTGGIAGTVHQMRRRNDNHEIALATN